ncbi:MAG: carbon-nitrogen hydrolase family protein [Desulfobacterales bacterium]|nr:carbon-nitrogen hydrolase family protein [Desulfobacterales bacterium]MCF8079955.1 carbon-nitrogen hydrolase family protein [Desulfobacterales bacterium]
MKATVCELKNSEDTLAEEWEKLVVHVRSEKSELVVLPEMPFAPWVAHTRNVDAEVWTASVEMHERWISRFSVLLPATVAGSRPVVRNGRRLNEAFLWDEKEGYRAVHHKYYLPDDEGWWEASWYERGAKEFTTMETDRARIGFLLCTELWFNEHARGYGRQGTELLVCPRATGSFSTDKWLAGGRTAAVVSGAWCLSSNFSPTVSDGMKWGGSGWIIEPEDGRVLGVTSRERPFLTLDIDPAAARAAKKTYPRYVVE